MPQTTNQTITSHVLNDRQGPVLTLTINRPEKKNALTGEMYESLANAITAGAEDESLRVIIIKGGEGCFCAGNDIGDFLKIAKDGMLPTSILKFLKALAANPKPLILAIDGVAVGIGTTMCFHADLIYATERSIFSTPFLDLGLIPEAASSYLMPKTMGHVRAFEMLVLGESFTAKDAKSAGIINDITSPEELAPMVERVAARLAAKPAGAVRIAKQLMRLDLEIVEKVMEKECELFAAQLKSPEAEAAFSAFLSKSKPS
ncbi:MAG: enoyl-CoA hydratase [Rhodomicrobium sp.]|nr:MAG: enoyl-CoA hydratase [Rhodomicrobium sp.]